MRKIFDFFVGQIILFFMFVCIIGFFYIIYSYSNNVHTPYVYCKEMTIENYQLTFDLNTGTSEIDHVLKLEVKDIVENKICLIADSVRDVMILFSAVGLVCTDIIVFIGNIIIGIAAIIKKTSYEKILKKKYDISDNTLYELPNYEPILANVIFNKSYRYETTVFRLKYYYRSIGVLNKFDKLKEKSDFDENDLTELERYVFNSEESEISAPIKNLFQTHQRKVENERKIFKEMIKKELVNKGFYAENIVQRKINEFISILKKIKNKERVSEKDVNMIAKTIAITLVWGIVIEFSAIALLALIIFFVWAAKKYSEIHLSLEGEVERAKLIFLINHLKIKQDLSEKEKFFLTMLTR